MGKITADRVILNEVPPYFNQPVTLRVVESTFGPNNAGNPQLALKCEIIEPEEYVAKDKKRYVLDGVNFNFYLPFIKKDPKTGEKDEKGTERNLGNVRTLFEKLGLDPDQDEENPDYKALEGICFRYGLTSKERKMQGRDENGSYSTMMEDGKPVVNGFEFGMGNVRDILRKVEVAHNRAF